MNAGCLAADPASIVPDGSMLAPRYPAAVAAGNVEVSQGVTNCLFGALMRRWPAAQGTMNNLTFGNDRLTSTTKRSAPARRPAPISTGRRGVHTHMTNSRLTDPEILETRFPVVLEEFTIRRGSGGKGGTRRATAPGAPSVSGDDGMRDSSGHRRVRPFGVDGGEPGQLGENLVRRTGSIEKLSGCASVVLLAGDAVTIVTLTGGGFWPCESLKRQCEICIGHPILNLAI